MDTTTHTHTHTHTHTQVAVLCMSVLDQFMESLGPSFHEAARKKTLDRLVKLSVPNSKECAPPVIVSVKKDDGSWVVVE
jgi:hypothetical protein